jgi:hypothetical protein
MLEEKTSMNTHTLATVAAVFVCLGTAVQAAEEPERHAGQPNYIPGPNASAPAADAINYGARARVREIGPARSYLRPGGYYGRQDGSEGHIDPETEDD